LKDETKNLVANHQKLLAHNTQMVKAAKGQKEILDNIDVMQFNAAINPSQDTVPASYTPMNIKKHS